MKAVVVYAVNSLSPFTQMMFLSIKTLRLYNKKIYVRIINTGEKLHIPRYCYPCEQVLVNGVFNRFPDDKCLLGLLDDKNIIYLDADTFVYSDIENLLIKHHEKFSARLSWTYQNTDEWIATHEVKWQKNLEMIGAKKVPVFNSGVLIFRDGAHQTLYESWVQNITRFYQGELLPVYGGERLFEQIALSLSIGQLNTSYSLLSREEHSYAWNNELSEETVILHTTSKWYEKYFNKFRKDV